MTINVLVRQRCAMGTAEPPKDITNPCFAMPALGKCGPALRHGNEGPKVVGDPCFAELGIWRCRSVKNRSERAISAAIAAGSLRAKIFSLDAMSPRACRADCSWRLGMLCSLASALFGRHRP
jgi:hypothetical protein